RQLERPANGLRRLALAGGDCGLILAGRPAAGRNSQRHSEQGDTGQHAHLPDMHILTQKANCGALNLPCMLAASLGWAMQANEPNGQTRPIRANLPSTMLAEPARDEALRSVGAAFGRTRLRTLVSLRWMAIAGQT